jgi:NAD(P)-dependent dehydrogenase (short-subunit alcohol dehydrogenase family)
MMAGPAPEPAMAQRVALVTHALEFAGPPAVVALRDAGFQVLAHDPRFADPAQRAAHDARLPGTIALVEQSADELVEAAWSAGGRLDVLVSNDAHAVVHAPVADGDIDALRRTFEALVAFPFALARAAIPRLRATPGSRVVMITSNRTRLPQAGGAIPDIARAGANALARSLAIELAPHGIPVNAIAPNFLASETYYPRARFVDDPAGADYVRRTVPAGRLARPEEIGELIRFLATCESTFLTGANIDFSGGWPAGLPRPG